MWETKGSLRNTIYKWSVTDIFVGSQEGIFSLDFFGSHGKNIDWANPENFGNIPNISQVAYSYLIRKWLMNYVYYIISDNS